MRYARLLPLALFGVLFAYFSACYQNHFYWQEQNQLFLLSADWLATYFEKPAWLACMTGDFLTQFYYYTYAGPALLAFLLVLTACAAYASLRRMAGKAVSLLIALAVLALLVFSMLDAYSRLASVIAILGGLLLHWVCRRLMAGTRHIAVDLCLAAACVALAFWLFGIGYMAIVVLLAAECAVKRQRLLAVAAVCLVAFTMPLCLQGTYNLHFAACAAYPGIKKLKLPETDLERTLDISNSYYFGRYQYVIDKVPTLGNPNKVEQFYYYLANARKGALADNLLVLPNPDLGTLNSIGEKTPILIINMMNDLYFVVGDMTYAERAAMMANVFSPQNRNARYVKRMAEANLVSGDTLAAMKYLRLLSHTLLYNRWAKTHMPDTMNERIRQDVLSKRKLSNTQDTLRIGDSCRTILTELLDSNAENIAALDYLLCTDLLLKDISGFKADYDRYCIAAGHPRVKPIYQQALLIWLAGTKASEDVCHRYITDISQAERFKEYNSHRGSSAFSNTYWYYFDTKK